MGQLTVSVNGMRGNMHNQMEELRKEISDMTEVLNGELPMYSIEQQQQDIKKSFNTIACSINAFQCCYDNGYENDFDDQGDKYEITLFDTED